jgi:hypothetical protein
MARGDKTIYMEVMIISSSSADGLNTKINTNLQNGWKPLGSHQVVRSHSQNRFRGDQLADTIHQSVYSITMIKEDPVISEINKIEVDIAYYHPDDDERIRVYDEEGMREEFENKLSKLIRVNAE